MGVSKKRKSEHRKHLVGETNRNKFQNGLDYTQLGKKKLPKGQTTLR